MCTRCLPHCLSLQEGIRAEAGLAGGGPHASARTVVAALVWSLVGSGLFAASPDAEAQATSPTPLKVTWRDSKAALVMIAPNKDISQAAKDAQAPVAAHATHVKRIGERDDTWTDHILHLPDDPGREVHVALMMFHIPK